MEERHLQLVDKIRMINRARKGDDYQSIGDDYEVSRQRVHQIVRDYVGPVKREVVPMGKTLLDKIFG